MSDLDRAANGSWIMSAEFAERLYADLSGAGLMAEVQFRTAYKRAEATPPAAGGCCDGCCAEPTCRNGMPLLTPRARVSKHQFAPADLDDFHA